MFAQSKKYTLTPINISQLSQISNLKSIIKYNVKFEQNKNAFQMSNG